MTNTNKNTNSRDSKPVQAFLPNGYLDNGYMDESGYIDIRYITDFAKQIGHDFGNDKRTGVSKIRSFYDNVTNNLTDCAYGNMPWQSIRNNIAILKARANNRFTKGTASKLFLDFISKNTDVVIKSKTEDEFKSNLRAFKDHFEAVICYMPKK